MNTNNHPNAKRAIEEKKKPKAMLNEVKNGNDLSSFLFIHAPPIMDAQNTIEETHQVMPTFAYVLSACSFNYNNVFNARSLFCNAFLHLYAGKGMGDSNNINM